MRAACSIIPRNLDFGFLGGFLLMGIHMDAFEFFAHFSDLACFVGRASRKVGAASRCFAGLIPEAFLFLEIFDVFHTDVDSIVFALTFLGWFPTCEASPVLDVHEIAFRMFLKPFV